MRNLSKGSHAEPTKEQVRHWICDRAKERKPLPDPDQIRRELGWVLIEATKSKSS